MQRTVHPVHGVRGGVVGLFGWELQSWRTLSTRACVSPGTDADWPSLAGRCGLGFTLKSETEILPKPAQNLKPLPKFEAAAQGHEWVHTCA
jgi:hypothetical protein